MTTPPTRRPGQNTGKRAKTVRDVQTILCPAWTGCHELTNDAGANTYCLHCGKWWRVLDAEVRAS